MLLAFYDVNTIGGFVCHVPIVYLNILCAYILYTIYIQVPWRP